MKTHNLAFIDLETTGLELNKHEITEIGCIVAKQIPQKNNGAKLEIIEEFEIKVKPKHIETADPVSLEITGYKEEDWQDAVTLKEAVGVLAEKTRGAIMVAHNVAFDWAFVNPSLSTIIAICPSNPLITAVNSSSPTG